MINSSSTMLAPRCEDIPPQQIDRIQHFYSKAPENNAIGHELFFSISIAGLLEDLRAGTAVAIIDGSYYPENIKGASRWIIVSQDDSEFISGGSMCPGPPSAVNAYRSELWGLLDLSTAVWAVEWVFPDLTSPRLIIGCDGESALNTSFNANPSALITRMKHFSIISGIMGYGKNIHAKAEPTWVESHLSDIVPYRLLPRFNRINEDMDKAAKRIVQIGIRRNSKYFDVVFQFRMGSIKLNGARMVTAAEKSIVNSISILPLRQYWLDICNIPLARQKDINWISFEKAAARLPHHRQNFLINWISQMTLVGSVSRKRKMGFQHCCPRCNDWSETHSHVITCYNAKARHLRNSLLSTLNEWMEKENTDPDIESTIMLILTQWMRKPGSFRLPYIYTVDLLLRQTVQQQQSIGWYNFILGMQHSGWATLQDRYYRNIPHCKKTGDNWASKLQFELWTFIWDLWQHQQDMRLETPSADDLAMLAIAKTAITFELNLGRDTLATFYATYFSTTEERLFAKTATDIRVWLRFIWGARESINNFANDLFSHNGPHRSWLGLRRRINPIILHNLHNLLSPTHLSKLNFTIQAEFTSERRPSHTSLYLSLILFQNSSSANRTEEIWAVSPSLKRDEVPVTF
mmetsp:Transcript_7611/g.11304  ORF Transcript_7611/g.11304 Transcript_7611/m.11304 type:complete len:633 (-) Transcript_7611:242-2140(-)